MQQLSRPHGRRDAGAGFHRGASGGAALPARRPQLSDSRPSVAEACATILAEVKPLGAERVALRDAVGRVLATDARSPVTLPPWDNASMDGYAARADDVRGAAPAAPVTLRVVETIAAGSVASRALARGQAMRIMTGAPVPDGADSVIRVEDTDAGEGQVRITSDRDALRNVRPRGEDVTSGQVALEAHTQLHAGHIGLLASIGCADVPVFRRPRVAILASGNELVDVDRFAEVLAGGAKIVSSNSYALHAAVQEAGGTPESLGIAADDPAALREKLAACDCDLLLTTGGVSVGAFDYTRDVLAELGMTMRFWRLRIRPGAPVGFGLLRGVPWLGLPGNPVSTLVTFELFARPAIRAMQGLRLPFRRLARARLAEAITLTAPLTHFFRARIEHRDGEMVARLTGPQGSGLLSSMARAHALLIVPAERPRVEAGEMVDALLLGDDAEHSASFDVV